MGEGASKLGCYCTQRDEDPALENAVAAIGAQQLQTGERSSCLPISASARRKRSATCMAGSPRKRGSKAKASLKHGPPPQCDQSDTVIIFDWDDTLLCSSAINAQLYTGSQLKTLERAVQAALTYAMNLGETIIVTNGNGTWVEESSEKYLPGVVPLLRQLRVVSARASYESAFPQDPFAWKRMAFREIFLRRQMEGDCVEPLPVNLVVIGDSCVEIEAAKSALKVMTGNSLVKTLKLKEAPGAHELIGELRKATLELGKLVQQDHKVNRLLVPRVLPAHLGHLHSWAAGWQLSDGRSHLKSAALPQMLKCYAS